MLISFIQHAKKFKIVVTFVKFELMKQTEHLLQNSVAYSGKLSTYHSHLERRIAVRLQSLGYWLGVPRVLSNFGEEATQ